MLIYFKYEQKYLSKVSCSNFFPNPIFAVRFCIQEKVESSINNFKRRVFNSQSLFNGGFKGADQGFLVQYCCPTVENLSPLGTQIGAFCVYPHRIGPEQRTKPIFIRTLHQGGHPRPHLASMLAAKQQLFSNKDSQLNLHCLIMQSFSTTTSHFNEEN